MLFDFRAAFPSIAHAFIHGTIAHLGLPPAARNLLTAFYDDNRCEITVAGRRFPGFAAASGIRQGCPLSPLIYVIVADALLRRLSAIGPEVVVRGYADDTAMVLTDLGNQWAPVQAAFTEFEIVSGLALNLPKTVLIPLGDADLAVMRRELQQRADRWAGVQIASWGLYLGFATGPGKEFHSWDRPLERFACRLREWNWEGSGFAVGLPRL